MAAKRIGTIGDDALIIGGIFVIGYSLLRNDLPSIFGSVSPEDKAALDNQQTLDPGENIFNVQSTPYTDWTVSNGGLFDQMQQLGVDTNTDFYLKIYRDFLDGNLSPNNPMYLICQIYHLLHGAVTGHILTGDQDQANQALNMIANKWQLGAVADLWAIEYGGFGTPADLFLQIRNGSWPMQYGLNPSDLATQIRRLNNLPD